MDSCGLCYEVSPCEGLGPRFEAQPACEGHHGARGGCNRSKPHRPHHTPLHTVGPGGLQFRAPCLPRVRWKPVMSEAACRPVTPNLWPLPLSILVTERPCCRNPQVACESDWTYDNYGGRWAAGCLGYCMYIRKGGPFGRVSALQCLLPRALCSRLRPLRVSAWAPPTVPVLRAATLVSQHSHAHCQVPAGSLAWLAP